MEHSSGIGGAGNTQLMIQAIRTSNIHPDVCEEGKFSLGCKVSNCSEIRASWAPSGDDTGGWVSSTQTYDWTGRPQRTTNPDATYRENSYGGCGCAGGEQTTTRDERGRRERYTKDVLDRLTKVEELNWNESVYSTTTNV